MITDKKYYTFSIVALTACLFACAGDLTGMFVFARFYPAYNQISQPISALGAYGSPVARLVSWWWIFIGFIFILFAYTYGKSNFNGHPAQRITSWLIGVYAAGEEIGSGVFPGNHIAGHLTTTGIVHNITGGLGVLALFLIPFTLVRKYPLTVHPFFNRLLWIMSIVGLFFFCLFTLSRFTFHQMHWLQLWHGLWQRLFVFVYYFLLVIIALKSFNENRLHYSMA
jgi:hypothetical protein